MLSESQAKTIGHARTIATAQMFPGHSSSVLLNYGVTGVLSDIAVSTPYVREPTHLDVRYLLDIFSGVKDQISSPHPCWDCISHDFFAPIPSHKNPNNSRGWRRPWRHDIFPITEPSFIIGDELHAHGTVFSSVWYDLRNHSPAVAVAEVHVSKGGRENWKLSPYFIPITFPPLLREAEEPELSALPYRERVPTSLYAGTIFQNGRK